MKYHLLLPLVAAGLVLLCACGAQKEPPQTEAETEVSEIVSFSFCHTTSWAEDCYRLDLTRDGDGVHLHAEELFSGGRVVDTMTDDAAMARLEELADTYSLDQWNGFDKSGKHVTDGSTFTLNITRADGSTVSAHGNNRFPERYSEFAPAIRALYDELMQRYADREGKDDAL